MTPANVRKPAPEAIWNMDLVLEARALAELVGYFVPSRGRCREVRDQAARLLAKCPNISRLGWDCASDEIRAAILSQYRASLAQDPTDLSAALTLSDSGQL